MIGWFVWTSTLDLERELRRELRRLVRLDALGGRRGDLARNPPRLVVRHQAHSTRELGCIWYEDRIIEIRVGPRTSTAIAKSTLLHELVHLYGFERHDRAFKTTLTVVAAEAYGVDVSHAVGLPYQQFDVVVDNAIWWADWRTWASGFLMPVLMMFGFHVGHVVRIARRPRRTDGNT